MATELWKPIPDTEDGYYISSHGRVYSTKRNILLKQMLTSGGYLQVTLCKKGKKRKPLVHTLVAQTFIHKSNENLNVNHIDGNKQNNHVNNLEWVTHKANIQHMLLHGLKKKFPNNLPNKAKRVLCVELDKVFESVCDASKITGVPRANISNVCRGIRNTAGGYTWKYIDKGEN